MLNISRALAELSVPRYTSYPTAPQFSAAVGPQDYAAWLSALPAGAALSLYIHVPYCAQLSTTAAATPRRCAGEIRSTLMPSVSGMRLR